MKARFFDWCDTDRMAGNSLLHRFFLLLAISCGLCSFTIAATSDGDAAADETTEQEIAAGGDSLTAITFNIRFANQGDGQNAWDARKEHVVSILSDRNPDIIGLQEVLLSQLKYLREQLPEFEYYGVGRDDGKQAGEFCPIFYRRDRFEVKQKKTIWLSPTSERPSKGWDAAISRIATLLQLRDKESGQTIWVANTHFDHVGTEARARSAALIFKTLSEHAGDSPVLLMGDFNCLAKSTPYRTLTQGKGDDNNFSLYDTRSLTDKPLGPDSTWNGFKEIVPGRRIDFMFVRSPWKVSRFEIVVAHRDGRFASDHLPVIVKFAMHEKAKMP